MSARPNQRAGGFTLAELLVALAVTALLVALLSRVFAAAASQWRTGDQRIDAFRDARVALQIMTRDLGRAHLNGDAQMLRLADFSGGPGFAKEAFAVAPIPNGGKSDLCATGFYCAWNPTAKAFTLKRVFKDSDVAAGMLVGDPPNFNALFSKDAAIDEDVAAYVWDLKFVPGTAADPVNPQTPPSTSWRWLEIKFKAMSAEAGKKLRNMQIDEGTWFNSSTDIYRNAILPHEHQFVSRVMLHQAR